ncbi:MAG TPA: protein kinase family protein, partial [Verrucomicrobiae bacterium]|nr:protein kinase family protein [Verrucomicrobiae bacterium]
LLTDNLPAGGTANGFTSTVSESRQSVLAGSLPYMAPEVIAGGSASVRSDLFSLGVVLWQLLAGDLTAALDPTDWAEQVPDRLLREDLHRCLVGAPERRWASAGEFALSLRSLQRRREAVARREAELKARERAAYRRGAIRTAAAAATVVALVGSLAGYAWQQRNAALASGAAMALTQAGSLQQTDFLTGRLSRGLKLLKIAAAGSTTADLLRLRSAAASVFALSDLTPFVDRPRTSADRPSDSLSRGITATNETVHALSHSGKVLATAQTLEDGYGVVNLIDVDSGHRLGSIARQDSPRVPLVEPALLSFGPGDRRLAVGGGATSRQILVCSTTNSSVLSSLYHSSDPLACAWHPDQEWLAVGCTDGSICLWDTATPAPLLGRAESVIPVLIDPLTKLSGHRSSVRHLSFSSSGRFLASIDDLGYLRVHSVPTLRAPKLVLGRLDFGVSFAVEMKLADPDQIESVFFSEEIRVRWRNGREESCEIITGAYAQELDFGSDIVHAGWNQNGTELCTLSSTDAFWIDPTRMDIRLSSKGCNAVGIGWDGQNWMQLGATKLTSCFTTNTGLKWQLNADSTIPLPSVSQDQATRTALSVNGQGHAAVYRGRQVLFFRGRDLIAEPLATVTNLAGRFSNVFWDYPGRLLGVLFQEEDRTGRLESWATTDTGDHCTRFPTRKLRANELVTPANDSKLFLTRGTRGLMSLDPQTGTETVLNASNAAKQFGPYAVTPSGRMLAMVVDQFRLHLLSLPDGNPFAELPLRTETPITKLVWAGDGRQLAVVTAGGAVRIWRLGHWLDWLAQYKLDRT